MEPLMLTLCLQDDSILLNSSIIEALEHPRQVQILINDEEKMLVLRACTIDDQQAVILSSGTVMQVEIGGRMLLRKVKKLTGWQDDQTRVLFGEYLPSHQAVRFNLMDARPLHIDALGDWNA